MILYKDIIFKLFGTEDKRKDVNKDVNGKGTLERFNEVVGQDIDDEVKPYADNLLDNVIVPDTMYPSLFPYREFMFGVTLSLGTSDFIRRWILKYNVRLTAIKGTYRCFTVLFGKIGVTFTSTDIFYTYGFDSTITLDDDSRTFDMGCANCSGFTLALTGSTLTNDILAALENIINYNTPINSILEGVSYNGSTLAVEKPSRANGYKYGLSIIVSHMMINDTDTWLINGTDKFLF